MNTEGTQLSYWHTIVYHCPHCNVNREFVRHRAVVTEDVQRDQVVMERVKPSNVYLSTGGSTPPPNAPYEFIYRCLTCSHEVQLAL